jgi:hypothetical protein
MSKNARRERGKGDNDLAVELEASADYANATEGQPDWDTLGWLFEEAVGLGREKKLTPDAIEDLIKRAGECIPKGHSSRVDILSRFEMGIRLKA